MFRTSIALLLDFPASRPANPKPTPEASRCATVLRYDGKPFSHWETYLRTELKADNRIDALRAMAAFGSRGYAKEATAAIVELLKDYDNDADAFSLAYTEPEKRTPDQRVVVHEALWSLGKIGGEGLPELLTHLDRPGVKRAAVSLYASHSIREASVPVLVDWIRSTKGEARNSAIHILGQGLQKAQEADKKSSLRAVYLAAVEKQMCEKAIVEAIIRAADDPGHGYLWGDEIPILLAPLGPRAKAAVPLLARWEVSGTEAATAALAEIKPTSAERVSALVSIFNDKNTAWRGPVATKLAEMGTDSRSALPDLFVEIKKPLPSPSAFSWPKHEIDERRAVVNAYVKIAGAKEALPILRELLDKDQVPLLERDLLHLCMKLESNPKETVSMLTKSLQRRLTAKVKAETDSEEIQRVAFEVEKNTYIGRGGFMAELVNALGARGEHAAGAVPLLLKSYEQSDNLGKLAIVVALGKIGPSAGDALPMLSKLLQSDNADMRREAAKAIEAITKK